MAWKLAQLNVARLAAPIDSPQLADFVANLDRINALADEAPGFVWRYVSVEGDTTESELFGNDMLVNLSVWENLEALRSYVYNEGHLEIMRRRKEWFLHTTEAYMTLWWIPEGHTPTLAEARARLAMLRGSGPSEQAFSFKSAFPAPAGEAP